jgi:hypothetical protein
MCVLHLHEVEEDHEELHNPGAKREIRHCLVSRLADREPGERQDDQG